MRKSSKLVVGMDVHKDSIDLATAEEHGAGEVRHHGTIGGDMPSLGRAVRKGAEPLENPAHGQIVLQDQPRLPGVGRQFGSRARFSSDRPAHRGCDPPLP